MIMHLKSCPTVYRTNNAPPGGLPRVQELLVLRPWNSSSLTGVMSLFVQQINAIVTEITSGIYVRLLVNLFYFLFAACSLQVHS